MRHFIHRPSPTGKYKSMLLIKDSSFNKNEIEEYYINPLVQRGYNNFDIFSMTLKYNDAGKAPAKMMKEYIAVLLKTVRDREIDTLLVADAGYFKQLTKQRKAEPHYGYIKPCAIEGFEDLKIVLTVNYQALFYNPNLQQNLDRSLDTMMSTLSGFHIEPGTNIIHSAQYITTSNEFEKAFAMLMLKPELTIDVETFGLDPKIGWLGTIAFAWDEHNGICFNYAMDKSEVSTSILRMNLLRFFRAYKGKCIYHGGTYDIKVLVFELFMRKLSNKFGMLDGLEVMTKNIDCTKVLTYLATNSTSGNKLDLKSNAAEFAGNYAQDDINDISLIPLDELMRYNLVDCLATWFVYNKNMPKVIAENQVEIYENILKPSIKLVVKMELVGMPLDANQVAVADHKLSRALHTIKQNLHVSTIVVNFEKRLKLDALVLKNSKLKKKVITEDEFTHEGFNANSNKQVSHLLHNVLKLDVIDITPTKQPSVGAGTLKKHLNQLISKYDLSDEDLQ